ncbi:MAG: hypothetical protein ACREE6_02360 [Limisphaerales bacterium]
MSLINDALKRASQSQQQQGDTVRITLKPPSTPAPKLQPARGLAIPVLIILLIATAGVFLRLAHHRRSPVSRVRIAAAVPPPVHVVAPPKPASPAAQTVAFTGPARTPSPPPPPPLKIQGISSYNAKWQAIVNGKTVFVGDTVNGFRIAVISRNNVLFIAPDGTQKKLALGE